MTSIVNDICDFFNVNAADVLSNKKTINENTSFVRGLCIYILRKHKECSVRTCMGLFQFESRRGIQIVCAKTAFRIENIEYYKVKYDSLIKEMPYLINK